MRNRQLAADEAARTAGDLEPGKHAKLEAIEVTEKEDSEASDAVEEEDAGEDDEEEDAGEDSEEDSEEEDGCCDTAKESLSTIWAFGTRCFRCCGGEGEDEDGPNDFVYPDQGQMNQGILGSCSPEKIDDLTNRK